MGEVNSDWKNGISDPGNSQGLDKSRDLHGCGGGTRLWDDWKAPVKA